MYEFFLPIDKFLGVENSLLVQLRDGFSRTIINSETNVHSWAWKISYKLHIRPFTVIIELYISVFHTVTQKYVFKNNS